MVGPSETLGSFLIRSNMFSASFLGARYNDDLGFVLQDNFIVVKLYTASSCYSRSRVEL
jgi:hypothetical protein